MQLAEPQRHIQTHGPALAWAPPCYWHHQVVLGGDAGPERHPHTTGKAQAGPSSPLCPWGRTEQRNKARRGHRDKGHLCLVPCSHRLSVPTTLPGQMEWPFGARCSSPWALGPFGVQDQAAGPSLLLGVQHQVLLPLCLHHLVELHGGSGVLHRGVTILPDLLGTETGCRHSPRHHSDTG